MFWRIGLGIGGARLSALKRRTAGGTRSRLHRVDCCADGADMSSSPLHDPLDPYAFRLDRQDPYLRVLCVNIFVRDQDRSLRFYVDQIGFALVIDESYESGSRWVAVAPPD